MSWTRKHREANAKKLRQQYEGFLVDYEITKEKVAKLYYEDGLGVNAICALFPGANIWKFMDENGMSRRDISHSFHLTKMRQLKEKGVTEEVLEDLYINQRLSMREIDKRLGCNVSYYLKYFDIAIRKNTDHNQYVEWTKERRNNHILAIRKYWSTPESRQLASNRMLKLLASGWRPNISGLGTMKFPTNPEKKLMNFINIACPNQYEYVGTNKVTFKTESGNIKPDFLHKERNKVIEMFGDYWHRGEDSQDRVNKFAQIGFDCLVIWEHELKEKTEDELVFTIQNFTGRRIHCLA